jgi:sigma-54-specific transcriptional regulator
MPAHGGDLRTQMRAYEIGLIVAALRAARGNRNTAAATLGVPLRTLAHRIQVLGITKADLDGT